MLLDLDLKRKSITIESLAFVGFIMSLIFHQLPCILALCWILMAYLLSGDRPTYIYAIIVTLPRDISMIIKLIEIKLKIYGWQRQCMTVPRLFQNVVQKYPNKVAIIMDDDSITFQEAEEFSNKIATFFKSKGIQRGDTVSLFMESRPEYPFIWLGLSKIGAITALINSNLKKETLRYSVKVAKSKAIIVGSELASVLEEVCNSEGVQGVPIFQFNDKNQNISTIKGFEDLSSELKKINPIDLSADISKGQPNDIFMYIYTSGTTGMPKASVVKNDRFMFIIAASSILYRIRSDDIIYCALPLYHAAGGLFGFGNVIYKGTTMAIRKKFSATNFWTDCIKYKCTAAQYIGEMCRYLLSTPQKPTDNQHSLRLMFGNGLRAENWKEFVKRFNIPKIGELYASTEGNANLVNVDNTIGAIGFIPITIGNIFRPMYLVRFDENSEEPIRDSSGRCIKCKAGEPGIFISEIQTKNAHSNFDGYSDKNETERKILRNVFRDGDKFFNSGDVLVRDLFGYFYFKDRIGDTFRWRGENVATSEVEGVISTATNLTDCIVYGVEIPHCEGKAGMAAIVDPDKKVNISELNMRINENLPKYARPIFLRLTSYLPTTGTFKLKKRNLKMEGYDLKKVTDPIYFLNNDGIYRPFTEKDYENILSGRVRL